MRKHRFFYPETLHINQVISLDAHHIIHVLRLTKDSIIYIFNNSNSEFTAKIINVNKQKVEILIIEEQISNTNSNLKLHLGLSIIKFDNIDLVLQKACELGVTDISLIVTEYTNIKNAFLRAQDKLEHWQRILISATAQCWRTTIPTLHIINNLQEFIASMHDVPLKFILTPNISNIHTTHAKPNAVSVLIGPEGGFSAQEIELAKQNNFNSLLLGPRILRTETACFCALTLMQEKFGDLT